jgi:hypothetical protein
MDHEITFAVRQMPHNEGLHGSATLRGEPISFAQAIELWQRDARFVQDFTHELASCPFAAYFFETPPLTTATRQRRFEFVLIDAPALARSRADSRSFRAKFDPGELTATFHNLRRDAVLVVPCEPHAQAPDCAHLASFSRTAGSDQQRALWQATAKAVAAELGDTPRWLSSSGLGVPWLHLRIDTQAKYYSYAPYRIAR